MRVTIEDGVYSLVIEVDRMYVWSRERAYDTKDWYFLVRVGMRGNLLGLEDEQVNQDLEGEGVGSGEWRKGELWNEKIYETVRFFEWISCGDI